MAVFSSFTITFVDSDGRESAVSPYVKVTDVQTFVSAANEAARDATNLGQLAADIAALSACTVRKRYVSYGDTYTTNPPDSTAEILRGNKIVISYSGGGRRYSISIPGRDSTAYNSTGVNVDIASLEMDDFVTTFENVATDINGNGVQVVSATLND